MKFALRIVSLAVAALMALAPGKASAGERSLGPKLGYVGENTSVEASLQFEYAISSHLRLAPEMGVVFRHKQRDALMVDLNLHFPMGFGAPMVDLYPLVGVNFSGWSNHGLSEVIGTDVSSRFSRIGVNVGAGFEIRCTPRMKALVEAKYCFLKDFSSAYVSAGVAYCF